MMRGLRDPEPPRCVVCDAPNPAGACCEGTTCPKERKPVQKERKERITKVEFYYLGGFSNSQLFRLQTRGGSWRYYRRVDL